MLTSVPSIVERQYLPSLNGLRAIACAMVIISHFLIGTHYAGYVDGFTGVQIFFVLSGFLITTLLLKEKVTTSRIDLRKFYIRRILRIFPAAYLYLIVLFILTCTGILHTSGPSFATAFLYLKNIPLPNTADWQTGHFWSLSYEEQFYLIFPFLLAYSVKTYIRLLILLLLVSAVITGLWYHGTGFFLHDAPHTVLEYLQGLWGYGTYSLLCGSLCAVLLFKGLTRPGFFSKYKGLGIYLLLLLILLENTLLFRFPGKGIFQLLLFAPGICVVLLMIIQPGNSLSFKLLNLPIMQRIGILSYSLYIWQQLFTQNRPWAGAFKYSDSIWFNLAGLCITASLSYYCFEKYFRSLKGRFAAKMSG